VTPAQPQVTTLEVTPEEAKAREHARDVREVMRVLTQLPRGLPTEFWGTDLTELSRKIVDGPKRVSPDGVPLVQIGTRWYMADLNRIGNYLEEYKEQKTESEESLSSEEKQRRLAQLEDRLLDGEISEETYERLRRKYED
jgi:hypothetical protein